MTTAIPRLLTRIAREHLGIPTLQTRQSDRLDFHDVGVWQVAAALAAAYEAGTSAPRPAPEARPGLPEPFDGYEIHGVAEYTDGAGNPFCEQVPDEQAQCWSLFGHLPEGGLECVGDFETRQLAEEVYARITGEPYDQ